MPPTSIATVSPSRRAAAARAGVQPGHGGRDHRHLLAEARSERAVVGLDLDLAELVGLRDEAQLAHVELVADDLGQPLDRLALGAGGHHDRGVQRLAQLDLRLAACGQAEAHGLARDRHRVLERDVALAGDREVAQVHARLGAVEVLIHLVGDERGERRQQLATA